MSEYIIPNIQCNSQWGKAFYSENRCSCTRSRNRHITKQSPDKAPACRNPHHKIEKSGFLPGTLRLRQNTISGVRSKKPISLFQLIPHLQCWSPINCCFILRPQPGQILLLFPIAYRSRLSGFNRKSMMPITTMPFSLRHSLILSFTTMIFLNESSMRTSEFCSCSIFSWSGIANAD